MIAHALDIERLANAMAAAVHGQRLDQVEPDVRAVLRVYANAALFRMGLAAKADGKAYIAKRLGDFAGSLRSAAASLEVAGGATETDLAAFHRNAALVEDFAAILTGMEAPQPPTEPPAPVEEEAV